MRGLGIVYRPFGAYESILLPSQGLAPLAIDTRPAGATEYSQNRTGYLKSRKLFRMARDEILNAIPHRDPFLFVDEVVELAENHIRCTKTFTGQEAFFAGHYPGRPMVPGVILCEAAMQAGAILLSRHMGEKPGLVPVATRMNDIRFKRVVRPGETLVLEAELVERLADAFFLKAKVTVDGKLSVRFEFACTAAKVE